MTLPFINKQNPLLLASASPRRRRLLEQVGLPFLALASHIEEELVGPDPSSSTLILAERKAGSLTGHHERRWVLGADTIVVMGERILGKPRDQEEARSMLLLLSGREHRVITGFSLIDPRGVAAHKEAVETLVRFKALTSEEIEAYIATGECFGKAGGYAIQGIGAFLVEEIRGSYTNVVGLPICALIKALLASGALETFPLPQGIQSAPDRA
jgi:septum formation protein